MRVAPQDVRDVERRRPRGLRRGDPPRRALQRPAGRPQPRAHLRHQPPRAVRLARLAKQAGVQRFVFSSSCSLYGAAGGRTRSTRRRPSIPSRPTASRRCWPSATSSPLADDDFAPTFLRNATAYGVSPRLRGDLVVNNLVGLRLLHRRGADPERRQPWRPLVHIEDISRAFLAVLEAPRELVHNEAFNVGRDEENYRIRDVAADRRARSSRTAGPFAPGASPTSALTACSSTSCGRRCPGSSRAGPSSGACEERTRPTANDLRSTTSSRRASCASSA